jgi:hypothetical protein
MSCDAFAAILKLSIPSYTCVLSVLDRGLQMRIGFSLLEGAGFLAIGCISLKQMQGISDSEANKLTFHLGHWNCPLTTCLSRKDMVIGR